MPLSALYKFCNTWREYCLNTLWLEAKSRGMAGISQTQTLSQQQVLAPQLQQSLQILQAPMLELRNLIQQEIQTNPTIEEEHTELTIEDRQQEHDEFKEEFDRLAKLDEE